MENTKPDTNTHTQHTNVSLSVCLSELRVLYVLLRVDRECILLIPSLHLRELDVDRFRAGGDRQRKFGIGLGR